MRVPIDNGRANLTPDAGQDCDAAVESGFGSAMTEEEMVEAAIRAGEQAAADDMKRDAERLESERDEYARKLASAEEAQEEAEAAAQEATEKYLRLQAEWQNFRRRTDQERQTERTRANERLVEKLLPVLDDMERAIGHARSTTDDDPNLMQFADGVEAVHEKMVSILDSEGVEPIDPAGEPFNPMDHQAVGREENPDVYEDTVSQVYQKGYRMGGKVIRSAMVTVTYGGKKRPQEKDEATADEARK